MYLEIVSGVESYLYKKNIRSPVVNIIKTYTTGIIILSGYDNKTKESFIVVLDKNGNITFYPIEPGITIYDVCSMHDLSTRWDSIAMVGNKGYSPFVGFKLAGKNCAHLYTQYTGVLNMVDVCGFSGYVRIMGEVKPIEDDSSTFPVSIIFFHDSGKEDFPTELVFQILYEKNKHKPIIIV